MNHVDLFSGIGGFALAAKWAGFTTTQFVEIDSFCQKVLTKNFPDIPIHDDIKTFTTSAKIDLLTGGFPCQPFSVAGKRKGKSDDRYMWPEMLRVICSASPTYVLIENVTGIISIALDDILLDLERERYATRIFVLPASAAQAPHKRERVWIIANRHGKRCDMWCDTWEKRFSQENINRNVQAIQSEWEKLKPQSWKNFNAQNWLANTDSIAGEQTNSKTKPIKKTGNAWMGYSGQNRSTTSESHWQENQPPIPGMDDGLPFRLDRNKALGNAIVPQIAYPILKIIYDIEKQKVENE